MAIGTLTSDERNVMLRVSTCCSLLKSRSRLYDQVRGIDGCIREIATVTCFSPAKFQAILGSALVRQSGARKRADQKWPMLR